jgi:3-phenylpropionate/cinnamic acid dioxygenase small subunit
MSPQLQDFIYDEARLLDEGDFEAWLALFSEDGRYWVPLKGRAQTEDERHNAMADETPLLLRLRVARLRGDRAHSQQVRSQCQHVLQLPRLLSSEAGVHSLYTPFTYAESRGEDMVVLHGHYLHRLRETPEGLRIALKRVNLVNAQSRLPMIQLFP